MELLYTAGTLTLSVFSEPLMYGDVQRNQTLIYLSTGRYEEAASVQIDRKVMMLDGLRGMGIFNIRV